MRPTLVSSALAAGLLFLATTALQAQTDVFIEYQLTGSVTRSGRDADVVLCSPDQDGRLTVHTLGTWVFSFELPSAKPGQYEANLTIAAPDSVSALHDNNIRTDDRLSGQAMFVVQGAGRGQMSLPLLRIRFTAKGLVSELGKQVDVEGTVGCAVM